MIWSIASPATTPQMRGNTYKIVREPSGDRQKAASRLRHSAHCPCAGLPWVERMESLRRYASLKETEIIRHFEMAVHQTAQGIKAKNEWRVINWLLICELDFCLSQPTSRKSVFLFFSFSISLSFWPFLFIYLSFLAYNYIISNIQMKALVK